MDAITRTREPIFLALAHLAQAQDILEREAARQEQLAAQQHGVIGAEAEAEGTVQPSQMQVHEDGTSGRTDGETGDDVAH
jgi:hypothetical protein